MFKRKEGQALRNVLMALENSGCRPGELRQARVRDWQDELGAIFYPRNDERTKNHKDRIILFTGEAATMIKGLIQGKKPNDYIFTTWLGVPYGEKSIIHSIKAVAKRLGYNHIIPYSYRHTRITNMIKAGMSVDQIGAIMGNTPEIIRKHYSHLFADMGHLRELVEKFNNT